MFCGSVSMRLQEQMLIIFATYSCLSAVYYSINPLYIVPLPFIKNGKLKGVPQQFSITARSFGVVFIIPLFHLRIPHRGYTLPDKLEFAASFMVRIIPD
jgi:hypothetical protein